MFCFNCGKELADRSLVCQACGRKQQSEGGMDVGEIYAGFLRRTVAFVLDRSLIYFVSSVGIVAAAGPAGLEGDSELMVWSMSGAIALLFLYNPIMEASPWQGTLGKVAMGLKVVTATGQRIGILRAFARHLLAFFSSILLIGYLISAATARRQTLHDLGADCLVVNRAASIADVGSAQPAKAGSGLMFLIVGAVAIVPVLGILAAVAIPAYQDYTRKAQVMEALAVGQAAADRVDQFRVREGRRPVNLAETGFTGASAYVTNVDLDDSGVILIGLNLVNLSGAKLILSPQRSAQGSVWSCRGEKVPEPVLPRTCRAGAGQ